MSFNIAINRRDVLDSFMSYREAGPHEAPVALFLHGNPTSSYVWRDIIPEVAPVARCIAPDLIGFGRSGKPDMDYRFADHARYLEAFIDAIGLSSAYLVGQDWGSALAFDLAVRRPEFVLGLVFMEFIRPVETWDEFHQVPAVRDMFQKFRTPGVGEALILEENVFLERILPGSIKRQLTPAEISAYRAPFPTPASRLPVWRFPNELPIGGEPADVWGRLEQAHAALRESAYPKVLLAGDPGALVSPAFAERFAGRLRNCKLIQLGPGGHTLQEDYPQVIGAAVRELIGRSSLP